MPPIVSIVGHSQSGKTTLIEKLIPELKSRGYRVATVKHTHHEATFDEPGKDSWRHIHAGSDATILSSQNQLVLIKPGCSDDVINEISVLLGEDYDIIIVEGLRQGNAPKIEVHRKEMVPLLADISQRIAIATNEPLETKTRQFPLDDVTGLADFLDESFIKPRKEELSLFINNAPIPLSNFPKELIKNVLVGIANSLKGVGEVKNLKLFLRKRE